MEDGRPKGGRRGWDPGPPQHSWFFLVLIALIWAVHRSQHPSPSTSLSASLSHNGFLPCGRHRGDASVASIFSYPSRFCVHPGGGNIHHMMTYHHFAISRSGPAVYATGSFILGRWPTRGAVTVSPPLSASLSHIDISSRGQHLIDASAASFSSVSSRFCAQPYTSLLGGGGNIHPMIHHQHAISGSDSAFCTTEGFVSGRLPALWRGDGFAIVIGFALPRRQLRLLSRKAPRLWTKRLSPHVAGQSSG